MKTLKESHSVPSFSDRCYTLLLRIPEGKVTSYAELARALGTKAYRAVGQAMHRNPNAPRVPCHRVVRSDGSLGGYAGGAAKKIALLRSEGVLVRDGVIQELDKNFYSFS